MIDYAVTKNQKVLLRADLNVPLHDGIILDDHRLQAILPTIKQIQHHGGMIILLTHIGRPTSADQNLSTKHLIPWFEQQGFMVEYCDSLEHLQKVPFKHHGIVLFENLRFFSGEKSNDDIFAQQLASCASVYINDAFATMHRHDSSLVLVPHYYDSAHKGYGLLVQKELDALNTFRSYPKEEVVIVLGGGKVETKLPIIDKLIETSSTLLLCPTISSTFMRAEGLEIGKSLIHQESIAVVDNLQQKAQRCNTHLAMPLDYLVSDHGLQGPYHVQDAQHFKKTSMSISIGPKTLRHWHQYLSAAHATFVNAGMGFISIPESLVYTQELLQSIGLTHAYKVAGGGETIATLYQSHHDRLYDFLSTGGGATLTYLAGLPLPGLEVLKK